jgi:hypothetical protein
MFIEQWRTQEIVNPVGMKHKIDNCNDVYKKILFLQNSLVFTFPDFLSKKELFNKIRNILNNYKQLSNYKR